MKKLFLSLIFQDDASLLFSLFFVMFSKNQNEFQNLLKFTVKKHKSEKMVKIYLKIIKRFCVLFQLCFFHSSVLSTVNAFISYCRKKFLYIFLCMQAPRVNLHTKKNVIFLYTTHENEGKKTSKSEGKCCKMWNCPHKSILFLLLIHSSLAKK